MTNITIEQALQLLAERDAEITLLKETLGGELRTLGNLMSSGRSIEAGVRLRNVAGLASQSYLDLLHRRSKSIAKGQRDLTVSQAVVLV